MCKEMLVIPVSKVVDPKRNNQKKLRAKEEERHKGVADPKKRLRGYVSQYLSRNVNDESHVYVICACRYIICPAYLYITNSHTYIFP
jgi:hypothetical protein